MKVLNKLTDILFPPRCGFCGRVVGKRYEICAECLKELEFVGKPICTVCGKEMRYCDCRGRRFAYKRCAAPLYYKGIAVRAVLNFKFYGRQSVCDSLSKLMAQTVSQVYGGVTFDVITEVPVHKTALRKKGYNHAALLSQTVSSLTGIPHEKEVLVKTTVNQPQHKMDAVNRRGNVFGIFEVDKPEAVRDKRILLCDDIMTTGSTLDECARMLKISGAKEVYCIAAAIVLRNNDDIS